MPYYLKLINNGGTILFELVNYGKSISRAYANINPISSNFYIGFTAGSYGGANLYLDTSYYCQKFYKIYYSTTNASVSVFVNGVEAHSVTFSPKNQLNIVNRKVQAYDFIEFRLISSPSEPFVALIATIEYRDSVQKLTKNINSSIALAMCNFGQLAEILSTGNQDNSVLGLTQIDGIDSSADWITCTDKSTETIFYFEI